MASATSSSEAKPSGFWLMKARIFSTPSGSIARRDVDQHQRGGVDVVLADGDQAGAAAHRRADQHRAAIAERGMTQHQVVDHRVLAVDAVGRPVRIAVAAGVERDRVVAGARRDVSPAPFQAWRVWPPPCCSNTSGPSGSPHESPAMTTPPAPFQWCIGSGVDGEAFAGAHFLLLKAC